MGFETDGGAWFECVPGKPKEGRVKIRLQNLEQHKIIVDATETIVAEYHHNEKTGSPERVEYVVTDEKLAEEMRLDFTILEWQDIKLDGKPLKCTTKNRVLMCNRIPAFMKFYLDSLIIVKSNQDKIFGSGDELGN